MIIQSPQRRIAGKKRSAEIPDECGFVKLGNGAASKQLAAPFPYTQLQIALAAKSANISPGDFATPPRETVVCPKSVREFIDSAYRARASRLPRR